MSKQPKSHLKRLATFDYINSAILLLVAVCCVYPFLYVFFVATTDGTYLARGEMTFLPTRSSMCSPVCETLFYILRWGHCWR